MKKQLKSQVANSPMRLLVSAELRHQIGIEVFPEGPNGEKQQGMYVLVSEPELLDALSATKVEKLEGVQRALETAHEERTQLSVQVRELHREHASLRDEYAKVKERLELVEEAMHEAYNVRGDWAEKAGASALRSALLRAVAHGTFVLPTTPGARFTAKVARWEGGRMGDTVTFETVLGREVMYWKGSGYRPIAADAVMENYTDHSLLLDES